MDQADWADQCNIDILDWSQEPDIETLGQLASAEFNSIQFDINFFTHFGMTREVSLWAAKKNDTKGYKNTNIAPGMHCRLPI